MKNVNKKTKTLNENSFNTKCTRGVTLISLVITVIIMLILAGVAISILTSDNGLFEKTKLATEIYEDGADVEKNIIARLQEQFGEKNIKYEIDKFSNWGTITVKFNINISDGIKNILVNDKNIEVEIGKESYTFEYDASNLSELEIKVLTQKDEEVLENIVIPENSYDIWNALQLRQFATKVNADKNFDFQGKQVNIMADIDLGANDDGTGNWNGEEFIPIGNVENKPFAGTLNGNGHTIKGMYVNVIDTNAGLFGFNKGIIKDLGIIDSYIYSNNVTNNLDGNEDDTCSAYIAVGAVVGKNFENGQIKNCYNKAKIKIESETNTVSIIGGVVGLNINSEVENCYNYGQVEGSSKGKIFVQAGVIGVNESGNVKNCNNYGEIRHIESSITSSENIGGVLGISQSNSNTVNCSNEGDLYFENSSSQLTIVGGVIANNRINSNANNLTNYGKIKIATENFERLDCGGVIGRNSSSGTISFGLNKANLELDNKLNVKTLYFGGVMGVNTSSTLKSSGNIAELSGKSKISNAVQVGGIVGYNDNNIEEVYNAGNVNLLPDENVIPVYIRAGGLIATNMNNGKIYRSYNIGNLSLNVNSSTNTLIGGLIGNNYQSVLINSCYNSGDIYCVSEGKDLWIGGIAGNNQTSATIEYSYNVGNIECTTQNTGSIGMSGVGALNMSSSVIQYCYTTGTIVSNSSANIAGIARTNNSSIIKNVYYKEGIANKDCVINTSGSSITASGTKVENDMRSADFITTIGNTYFVSDIENKNEGYPILNWQ